MNDFNCPHCGSSRLNKTGVDRHGERSYQRYYCRDCYRITTKPIIKKEAEDITVEEITPAVEDEDNVLQ